MPTPHRTTDRDGKPLWKVQITYTDLAGVRHWARISDRTKEGCAAKAATEKARLQQTARLDLKDTTVATYLAAWLDGLSGVSESTRLRYTQEVRKHLIPALGRHPLTKLTALHVRRLVRDMEQQELAPATIDHVLDRLKQALGDAVTWGLLPRNVAHGVKGPPLEPTAPTLWTTAQMAKFLAQCETEPTGDIWRLALGTACRIGELAALTWGDVDLDAATLTVRRTMTRDAKAREVIGATTKGRRARTVPLPAPCVTLLRARFRDHPGTPEAFVFTNQRGSYWQTDKLRDKFRRVCLHAGVPVLHPHALRHQAVSWLAEQGVPLHAIQSIAGHSAVQQTLAYGRGDTDEMRKQAAEALGRYLEAKPGQ